eukprot:Tbor_TRINITY_DN5243_c0_g1::TRINITY_DN5243_c0_g1_i1::g.16785::m.16785
MNGLEDKDVICAQIYIERMKKIQVKIRETSLFSTGIFDEFIPQQFIDVGWGDQNTDNVALFGNVLQLKNCLEKPNVIFEPNDACYYTILAFNADHEKRPYLQWLRMNVVGDLKYASGRDIFRWQPVLPSEEGKLNQLFIVVFHQADGDADISKETIISKSSTEGRASYDINALRKKWRLENIIGVNSCRFGYDKTIVPKALPMLREKVILDPTGRKVIAEMIDGKMKHYKNDDEVVTPQ